jgi:hypothetical protein
METIMKKCSDSYKQASSEGRGRRRRSVTITTSNQGRK